MDDREPLKNKDFTQRLFGKIFADRGYISQELFERLFIDDIHLVTKLKKNMKNSLIELAHGPARQNPAAEKGDH